MKKKLVTLLVCALAAQVAASGDTEKQRLDYIDYILRSQPLKVDTTPNGEGIYWDGDKAHAEDADVAAEKIKEMEESFITELLPWCNNPLVTHALRRAREKNIEFIDTRSEQWQGQASQTTGCGAAGIEAAITSKEDWIKRLYGVVLTTKKHNPDVLASFAPGKSVSLERMDRVEVQSYNLYVVKEEVAPAMLILYMLCNALRRHLFRRSEPFMKQADEVAIGINQMLRTVDGVEMVKELCGLDDSGGTDDKDFVAAGRNAAISARYGFYKKGGRLYFSLLSENSIRMRNKQCLNIFQEYSAASWPGPGSTLQVALAREVGAPSRGARAIQATAVLECRQYIGFAQPTKHGIFVQTHHGGVRPSVSTGRLAGAQNGNQDVWQAILKEAGLRNERRYAIAASVIELFVSAYYAAERYEEIINSTPEELAEKEKTLKEMEKTLLNGSIRLSKFCFDQINKPSKCIYQVTMPE
jgi:hypothetical protein